MAPLTRAEATGYLETSRHADVLAFLSALSHPFLHRTSFGTSPEGRDMPLLVLSTRGVKTPEEARRAGLPVVLVINGIHAGEVEGKEASMMLVRDLLSGAHAGLLEAVTLVVVPLFNPDGNDRIDPKNRVLAVKHLSGQMGPESGVGTRVNASGINLNRDYLRQESAEMRALQSRVAQAWQPDLTIDCHATNGSVHRFDLTYDVPHTSASGAPAPIAFMRDVFTPAMQARVKERHGRDTFWYGNFVDDEGGQGEGWMTYTHHPRFGSNYRGLTGRCDVLFEAYAYIPFEERVKTTYGMLVEALRLAGERADGLLAAVEAGGKPPDRIAVRSRLVATGSPARILTRSPRTLEGAPSEVSIPHLGRFEGTHVVDRPRGYVVPPPVAELLARHGLPVRRLVGPMGVRVEVPVVEEVRETDARSILEAPGETLVTARWEAREETLPAGTHVVDTTGRLSPIAVYLCEAESDDGLAAAQLVPPPKRGDTWPAWRIVG
jgi:hypothetical protein